MSDPTLTAAIEEAFAVAPSNVVVYHTLEINHVSFATPIRVVRDWNNLTATLEATAPHDPGAAVLFAAYPFNIVPPEVTSTAVPQCTIEIDNVTREILAQIDAAIATPDLLTVIYRMFISTDLSGPQNNPPMALTANAITADVFRIRMTAGFGDYANRRWPKEDYTSTRFPGLIQS